MDPASQPLASFVGFLAGSLTTASFLPQVIRSWQRRSAADLSLAMLLVYIAGVVMWMYYGIVTEAPAVIITNAVSILIALVLLGIKLRFG